MVVIFNPFIFVLTILKQTKMNNTVKNYLEDNKGKTVWISLSKTGKGKKRQLKVGSIKMGKFNTVCFMDGQDIFIYEFGMFRIYECIDYSLMTFDEIK